MTRAICLFALFGISFTALSQKDGGFEKQFNEAKDLLYNFHPDEALPLLLDLEKKDPGNANIHYLIGACYTDYSPGTPEAITYLEKAEPAVSDDYNADSPNERNASVHLYYFLAVAYAQNHHCEKAEKSNERFRKLIGRIGGAYIRDAEFWVKGCYELRKIKKDSTMAITESKPASTPSQDDPYAIENAKIVTQNIEYTTPSPLWGVQVGSFSKYVPMGDFDDIKNVDAFIDKNGKVRYVVGSFVFKHQAETLLKVLKESGYKDAFLVDVNKERRYADRIITINNISIRQEIRGKVHYRCQIGAFRDTIPKEMAEKYVKIDGIIENKEGDLTLLSVGRFNTYEEAVTYKEELGNIDIRDAFVVAYNYDEKISIQQARAYQEKQKTEQ